MDLGMREGMFLLGLLVVLALLLVASLAMVLAR